MKAGAALAAFASAVAVVVGPGALADPPPPATARTLAALPELAVVDLGDRLAVLDLAQRPKGIAASERDPALWTSPPRPFTPSARADASGPQPLVVAAPAQVPIAIDARLGNVLKLDTAALARDTCVATSRDGYGWTSATLAAVLERAAPLDVAIEPADIARAQASEDVWLVRVERLVEGAAGATLERTDAWVDVRTGGARRAAQSKAQLAVVQRLPGGVVVYGAREGDRAVFVVAAKPVTPQTAADVAESGPEPWLSVDGSDRPGRCGHRVVSLSAERGMISSETVPGVVTIPVVDGGDRPSSQAVKQRAFAVTLSEGWLGGGASPVLGATFGWVGEPSTLASPAPPPPPRKSRRSKGGLHSIH